MSDLRGFALFMGTQSPIPSNTRELRDFPRWKQVCVIGFRFRVLQQFMTLAQTTLEQTESIDMLRLMENGVRVKLVSSRFHTLAVDTRDGLRRVEALMASDPLVATY